MVTAWFVARKAGYPTETFPGWGALGGCSSTPFRVSC
jgi:hypothetical protein